MVKCGHCGERHEAAEVRQCWENEQKARYEDEQARIEQEAELGYERWLEDGGAASEIIQWENEQDRLRELHLIP